MSYRPRPLKWPPIFPLQKGLVLWLPMDERSGAIVYDRSGKANHGTLYGPTWVARRRGSALSFDGVDDYVLISNSASLQVAGNLTIIFRVYLNSLSSTRAAVSKMWHEYLVKIITDGTIAFEHQGAAGWEGIIDVLPQGSMTSGTWIHVAVVRDMSSMTVRGYKNGVAGTPRPFTKTPAPSKYDVNIGRESDGYYKLDGLIDEVRIYNRALNAAEVKCLYESELMLART